MKRIIIFIAICWAMVSACTKSSIDNSDTIYEITKIEASFDASTKCTYTFGSDFIYPSWEVGDTITIVAGLNYRYYVADNCGATTTFHLSDENPSPLEAHNKETVYAITGRYELKDYTYALTNGTLLTQQASNERFPMNIMRATSQASNGELNLKFSHILSYLHLRIPENIIVENNYELRLCCPNEYLFPYKGSEAIGPEGSRSTYTAHVAGGHPHIDGDEWYEGSQEYKNLLFNIREGEFVSFYNYHFDYTYSSEECLIQFSNEIKGDSENMVDVIVAVKASDSIKSLIIYGSTKPYKPLFSKAIPDGGITANTFINVNLEEVYHSTDYSKDGEVKQLQKATLGQGIDLVFMADYYVDTDMEDNGAYETYVKESVDYFFSYDPYSQYRERFNVYCVKAICPYSNCRDTDSPLYKETDCYEYAKKAINSESKPLRVVVLHNPASYETVSRSYATSQGTADFCIRMYQSSFLDNTLTHELSHGLAFLYDEYQEWSDKTMPEEEKSKIDEYHSRGYYLNVDYDNNPATVIWSDLLSDSRFSSENIGIYDKAYYAGGLYKSSENSIMKDSHDCKWFNAQSRKAIYINLMKASEGDSWEYNYEDFVAFDEEYRKKNPAPFQ